MSYSKGKKVSYICIYILRFTCLCRYTPGKCDQLINQNQCLNARIGAKCVWHKQDGRCLPITKHMLKKYQDDDTYMKCLDDAPPRGMTSHEELCKLFTDCISCVQTSYNCIWCDKGCVHEKCRDHPNSPNSMLVTDLTQCPSNGIECLLLHTCHACEVNPRCFWSWISVDRCSPKRLESSIHYMVCMYFNILLVLQNKNCKRINEYSNTISFLNISERVNYI